MPATWPPAQPDGGGAASGAGSRLAGVAERALGLLAALLDHLLGQQPQGRQRLRAHAGKAVQWRAAGACLQFEVGADGNLRSVPASAAPALRVDVDLQQWLAAQARGGPQAALGGVRISGDAEFAQVVSALLGQAGWDAEADLARLVGDVVAHRAVRAARTARERARELASRIEHDTRDWLREDARGLVGRQEFEAFAADVARLRDAAARLDKRLAVLRGRLRDPD